MELRVDIPACLLRDCRPLLPDCGPGTLAFSLWAVLQGCPESIILPIPCSRHCMHPRCRLVVNCYREVADKALAACMHHAENPFSRPGKYCGTAFLIHQLNPLLQAAACFEFGAEVTTGLQCIGTLTTHLLLAAVVEGVTGRRVTLPRGMATAQRD